jgi:hypothetical protein
VADAALRLAQRGGDAATVERAHQSLEIAQKPPMLGQRGGMP